MKAADVFIGDVYKIRAPGNLQVHSSTGPSWAIVTSTYGPYLDGGAARAIRPASSGFDIEITGLGPLRVPSMDWLIGCILTLAPDWLEPMGMVTTFRYATVFKPSAAYQAAAPIMTFKVGESWKDDDDSFTGYCDPKTHPEFRGWCGRQHRHGLGCPMRKK